MRADRRGDNTASLVVDMLPPSECGVTKAVEVVVGTSVTSDTTGDDLETGNGGNSLVSLPSTMACMRPIFGSVFRRISVVRRGRGYQSAGIFLVIRTTPQLLNDELPFNHRVSQVLKVPDEAMAFSVTSVQFILTFNNSRMSGLFMGSGTPSFNTRSWAPSRHTRPDSVTFRMSA